MSRRHVNSDHGCHSRRARTLADFISDTVSDTSFSVLPFRRSGVTQSLDLDGLDKDYSKEFASPEITIIEGFSKYRYDEAQCA